MTTLLPLRALDEVGVLGYRRRYLFQESRFLFALQQLNCFGVERLQWSNYSVILNGSRRGETRGHILVDPTSHKFHFAADIRIIISHSYN